MLYCGTARSGKVWFGWARSGMASQGQAGFGPVGLGRVWCGEVLKWILSESKLRKGVGDECKKKRKI